MGVSVSCMQESSIKPRDKTVASRARLEALANVQAKMNASTATDSDEVLANGCRLAYSSALNASSDQEAQALLAGVFTQALTKNPPKQIGGMLFYDEQTHVCVQVLEGPALAVRALYHEKIKKDDRHNSVRLLWDEGAETRHYDGFGMQLGSDPAQVLQNTSELLQLTYVSQLTASSREEAYKHMESILGLAFVKNPRLGIGGALFLNPRTLQVLQALEGPEANVRRLYEKIAKDARHTECTIVSEVTVKERTYEQWGMLQGDLKDWSSIAVGKIDMRSVASRRRRARENMTEADDGGEKRLRLGSGADAGAETPPQGAAVVTGEIKVASDGARVVAVAGDGVKA